MNFVLIVKDECKVCEDTIKLFKRDNLNFEVINFNNLKDDSQAYYTREFEEIGVFELPFILQDEEPISLHDII